MRFPEGMKVVFVGWTDADIKRYSTSALDIFNRQGSVEIGKVYTIKEHTFPSSRAEHCQLEETGFGYKWECFRPAGTLANILWAKEIQKDV
jgi:hypothetical protein